MNQEAVCWLKDEIKKRYGNVKRARGIYLYTEKSVRLTDCFLDGGRAILGHGGGKAKPLLKTVLNGEQTAFTTLVFYQLLKNL